MRTCNQRPECRELPLRLSESERQDPWMVMEAFFNQFQLNDTREMLWNWLSAALGSDHPFFQNPRERANILFFYEQLEACMEAAFLLKEQIQKERNGAER